MSVSEAKDKLSMLVERVESNHDAELAEAEADVVAGRMFSLDDVRAQPAKR